MRAPPCLRSHNLELPPAYRLVALGSVDSTNEVAKRLAATAPESGGAEDGTLIWAREQTAGKGRLSRSWDSPPGNLYLSLILRPEAPPAQAAQLSFVAAVALGAAVRAVAPPPVEMRYKWPNDLLLDGGKAAGILLESGTGTDSSLDWLVIGVGVNVANHPHDAGFAASSLHGVGARATVEDMLSAFSKHLFAWTERWLDRGFGPVRSAWLDHAYGLGEEVEVAVGESARRGLFKDIDETGALLLEGDNGAVETITAGDVFLIG